MAKTAIEGLREGEEPQQAAKRAMRLLGERAHGTGGLILVDRQGRIGASFSTPHMAYAYRNPSGSLVLSP